MPFPPSTPSQDNQYNSAGTLDQEKEKRSLGHVSIGGFCCQRSTTVKFRQRSVAKKVETHKFLRVQGVG